MKNSFNGWDNIATLNINDVSGFILHGKKVYEMKPDSWALDMVGDDDVPMTVLDFGCGIGRNIIGFANINKKWKFVGYDNECMISRIPEFVNINYNGIMPTNVEFISDWDKLKNKKFDKIFCMIVLQHIKEDVLVKYIQDFKKMTSLLYVSGRRYNDDIKNRSNWTIMEEQGLIPQEFYSGYKKIKYTPLGDPNDHNTAIYHL